MFEDLNHTLSSCLLKFQDLLKLVISNFIMVTGQVKAWMLDNHFV